MQKYRFFWAIVQVVLGLELLAIAWATWASLKTLVALLGASTDGQVVALQLSIVVVLLLGGIWLFATLRGALQRKPWVRASNFTIQILMLATATGILQGIIASKPYGFALLVLSLLGIVASAVLAKPEGPIVGGADGGRDDGA